MATSQNGWTVRLNGDEFKVVAVPPIIGSLRAGDVATVLGYVLAQFDARVEDADKGKDDWGGNVRPIRGQSSGYSNHASWTAMDVNAMLHPRGAINTFSAAEQKEIHEILDEVEGTIRWGGDYNLKIAKRDDMHFEVNVGAAALAKVAAKIKAGTIKPSGGGIKPRPPEKPTVPVKAVWTGISVEDTKLVQRYLKQVTGDYKGIIDGIYGPMMVEAVKRYQRRQNQYGKFNLKVDGHWDSKVQAHYEWVKGYQDLINDWNASQKLGALPEDGDFGNLSWKHTKAVQSANGKAPDGFYYKAGGRIADGDPGPITLKMIGYSKHP